jgi:hypothetical protein
MEQATPDLQLQIFERPMFKLFRFRLLDQDGRFGKVRPIRDTQFIWVQKTLQILQGRELGIGVG